MINKTFFEKYEQMGELSIDLVSQSVAASTTLQIWQGYFEGLMTCMLEQLRHDKGLLYEYYHDQSWICDENWDIPDLSYELEQFHSFSISKISDQLKDEYSYMMPIFPPLIESIITSLQNALNQQGTVAIHYNI